MIKFEWDNKKELDIPFESAKSVFYDDNAIQFYDEDHANYEDRFIILGMNTDSRTLIVCDCERLPGKLIRIISARNATEAEGKHYQR